MGNHMAKELQHGQVEDPGNRGHKRHLRVAHAQVHTETLSECALLSRSDASSTLPLSI